MSIRFIVRMLVYLVFGFFLIWLYDEISDPLTAIGGKWFHAALSNFPNFKITPRMRFEYPFIAVFLLILYFDRLKNPFIKYLLAVLPVVIAYLIIDVFFLHLERVPRWSDVKTIYELFLVSPIIAIALLIAVASILISILFLFFQVRKNYSVRQMKQVFIVKGLVFVGSMSFLIAPSFIEYHQKSFKYTAWSERHLVKTNGRFSSLFYFLHKDARNRQVLKEYTGNTNIREILFKGLPASRPNIHIVVLESFVDPRLLKNMHFNRSPLADELRPFLNGSDHGFSHVISPAYGGGSVRAGFELLTGIKSLSLIDPIEFNLMKGGKIDSLPFVLSQHGYSSISTFASNSMYFNERLAYNSLSVDNPHYLEESEGRYTKRKGDVWVFDGDMFAHNLEQIEVHMATKKNIPLFSYIEGMYGHSPYFRNKQKRPDVIISESSKNSKIADIANQFYYRTKALGKYLKSLKAIDPKAIVYVTSDHLPPILGKGVAYKMDRYENISFMLHEWADIDVSGQKYYEIPWLIWDMVTGNRFDRSISDERMKSLYFTALKQSISVRQ